MHYATINGIGSRIFCPVVKAMLVALRRITGCSWRPFFSGIERASHGAIFRSASEAKSGVFERIFKMLASDHDNEYMMIDATIVRAHQHSAGARKKTASKRSVDPAAD
jgi:transposase